MARGSKTRRFLALLSAGLVLVAIAWAYLQLTYGRPVGHGAAGPVWTNTAVFEQPWSSRPVLVVGLGDSVTAGFGARPGYSYFDRVVRPAVDDFPEFKTSCLSAAFPSLSSTNLAVSGSTSFECLSAQVPRVPKQDEQTLGIVLITTGGNNLIHNYGRTPELTHNKRRPGLVLGDRSNHTLPHGKKTPSTMR